MSRFCFVCIKQEYNKVILTMRIYHCLFYLSAIFMIIGFSVFADKARYPGMDFGYSFYLAIVSSVLHVLVAVFGGVQMWKVMGCTIGKKPIVCTLVQG